jgi:hypothetical protein
MASSAATAARTTARNGKTTRKTTTKPATPVKEEVKTAPATAPEQPKQPTKAERREAGKTAIEGMIADFAKDPVADGMVPLSFMLVNGDFRVHRPDCKSVITDFMKSDYTEPAAMGAASARAAVLELWDDQIRESDTIADATNPTEDELAVYYGATDFHGCVKFPGDADAGSVKRDAKHALARAMIEAMGAAYANLDPKVKEALGGDLAAGAIASAWVHHLPTGENAGKRIWPTDSLPRPDRSDWR